MSCYYVARHSGWNAWRHNTPPECCCHPPASSNHYSASETRLYADQRSVTSGPVTQLQAEKKQIVWRRARGGRVHLHAVLILRAENERHQQEPILKREQPGL